MAETRALARLALAALAALACLAPPAARAEKADRDKPMQIEANSMSSDDAARISIFEGNVVLTQGTIRVLADRIVVHQDADGFQYATATGKPVRFRQRTDPQDGQPAEWINGEADRIEINEREQKIELFDHAWVTRGLDKVQGDYISVDERSQYFSVKAGPNGASGGGRVRAVIQPKTAPAAPAGAPAAPAPATPAAK
ncbi:MAG: lipopolysaccharide transport periplasmic protein LptA [Betaproteobacteria bacterium]|nr:lipopolysaccharide transport periplasmic protein LptA [Betaproteobacteria bacterium]